MSIQKIKRLKITRPLGLQELRDKRAKALVRKPTLSDFVKFDEVDDGKRQLNVTINQTVAMASPCSPHPAFVRLPKNGERCPVSSLNRSTLQSLIRGDNPKVESIVIMDDGKSRGCRAIVTKSLIDYLNSHRKGVAK